MRHNLRSRRVTQSGFVLTELLAAALITSFLMLGLVQMATATTRGLSLVASLSRSQQGGRFAVQQMQSAVMAAGFNPAPWGATGEPLGLSDDSQDGGAGGDDKLVVSQISDRNCFDLPNPVTDVSGNPAFYLRISTFERSGSGNLAHTCFYGPDAGTLVRQINREGLVQNVESFQLLFVEDTNGDRRADRRVRAGQWGDAEHVLGVEVGILLKSEGVVGDAAPPTFQVLDETVSAPGDGRLRRVWTFSIPFGSRLR